MLFETILGGLFVASATGLAFVAYRHPEVADRFFWVVAGLFGLVALVIRVYSYGVASAMQIFHATSEQMALQAMENLDSQIHTLDTVYWAFGALAVIALGLTYLPKMIGRNKERESKDKGQAEGAGKIEENQ